MNRMKGFVLWALVLCLALGQGALADFVLPDNARVIGQEAFMNDASLPQSLTLSNQVTEIGSFAFAYTSVRLIYIPDSVVTFGEKVFEGCDGLVICGIVGSAAEQYAQENGHTFRGFDNDPDHYQFTRQADGTMAVTRYLGTGTDLTIPAQTADGTPVTAIEDSAFMGNRELRSVTIPQGILTVGEWAFANCDGLTRLSLPEGLTEIGDGAFYMCTALCTE